MKILSSTIIFLIIYLAASFIIWDMNPSNWSERSRLLSVFLAFCGNVMFYGIRSDIQESIRNEIKKEIVRENKK